MVQQLLINYDIGLGRHLLTFNCLPDLPALPSIDYTVQPECTQIKRRSGSAFRFFRAELKPSNSDRSINVILKIDIDGVYFNVLSHEADLYERSVFKGLVPRFYGLFQAKYPWHDGRGQNTINCL